MFKQKRLEPREVFTPRRTDVNPDMYVRRADLERKLLRAVDGSQHIIIFGDSGSGKTWLYKKVFAQNGNRYRTVDLSIAIKDGLNAALKDSLPDREWEAVEKEESDAVKANFVVATPSEARKTKYKKAELDPLDCILADLSASKGPTSFIVFDNFEQISSKPDLLEEITSLIIRLDNAKFSSFNVRFLFVGVVSDMKELVAKYDFAGTVTNRLVEVPEVERLTDHEATQLVDRGMVDLLKVEFENDMDDVVTAIKFMSDRNAQQLHELCYELACEARDNDWVVGDEQFAAAKEDWSENSLSIHKAQVEARMNKRDTKIQRRNQVLFCLGVAETSYLRVNQVDQMIRKHFPDTVSAKQLGVDQIMSGLAEGTNPILRKNPNENTYRLSHPKLRQALRIRLEELSSKKTPTIGEALDKLKAILEKIEVNSVFDLTDMGKEGKER